MGAGVGAGVGVGVGWGWEWGQGTFSGIVVYDRVYACID